MAKDEKKSNLNKKKKDKAPEFPYEYSRTKL